MFFFVFGRLEFALHGVDKGRGKRPSLGTIGYQPLT